MGFNAAGININRQTVLCAYQDFDLSDLEDGVAVKAIHLPAGSRILRGFLDISEAFDSTTSDTLSVGDEVADDVDKYLVATDVQSTGLTAFSLTPLTVGQIPSGGTWVTLSWTSGGGTPAAGKGRLQIEYVVDGRQTEFHPVRPS
jgi:hypothetical protein